MGEQAASAASSASASWFTRGFVLLCALWLVAQRHAGSFLAPWGDRSSLPGNICWLLILYCLARLLIDWGVRSVRLWRISRDALLFLGCLFGIELLWRSVGGGGGGVNLGLAAFFVQPVMVIFGFAALHRRRAVVV